MPSEEQQDDVPLAVIVPVGGAATNVAAAIQSVASQDYAGPLELCVAVDPLRPHIAPTVREIVPDARIVDNPARTTSAGLNAALRETTAPIVVRCDAHSAIPPNYLRQAVATLRRTGAANVGGRQVPAGTSWFTRAVALAQTTWLGTGGARYRQGGREGPVDTVYLGTFRRDALEKVGGFNTACRVNEDYEVNWKLRQCGETVWFDPALEVAYQPRQNLWALARQYFTYGCGKWAMLRIYPKSTRLRQVAAPLLVLGLAANAVFAAIGQAQAALVLPSAWLAVLFGGSLLVGVRRRDAAALLLPLTLATIQLSWGSGFLGCAIATIWRKQAVGRGE